MTPQMLWVLKAHTKTDKMADFCQNVRQDFDIYRNIDHRKSVDIDSLKNKKTRRVTKCNMLSHHTKKNKKKKKRRVTKCNVVSHSTLTMTHRQTKTH